MNSDDEYEYPSNFSAIEIEAIKRDNKRSKLSTEKYKDIIRKEEVERKRKLDQFYAERQARHDVFREPALRDHMVYKIGVELQQLEKELGVPKITFTTTSNEANGVEWTGDEEILNIVHDVTMSGLPSLGYKLLTKVYDAIVDKRIKPVKVPIKVPIKVPAKSAASKLRRENNDAKKKMEKKDGHRKTRKVASAAVDSSSTDTDEEIIIKRRRRSSVRGKLDASAGAKEQQDDDDDIEIPARSRGGRLLRGYRV